MMVVMVMAKLLVCGLQDKFSQLTDGVERDDGGAYSVWHPGCRTAFPCHQHYPCRRCPPRPLLA